MEREGPARQERSRGPRHAPGGAELGTVRWLASSSGNGPRTSQRRREFPNSSLSAWEAAVERGRRNGQVSAEPGAARPGGVAVAEADLDDGDAPGVEANARLTGMTAAVLLVLFAAEGLTILRITSLLTPHVVIGMLLVPPILVKMGSTGWRFTKYYLGSPEYRRKGPPPPLLRLLGPFVVVLTVALMASGIALLLAPVSMRSGLLTLHKAAFVLWFIAMVVHVLGHLLDTARLAPRDFYWRTRHQVRGAGARQWLLVGALGLGLVLAVALAPKVGPWLTATYPGLHKATVHVAPHPTAGSHATTKG